MTSILDRRSLRLADVVAVDPPTWFGETLPRLIAENGELARSAVYRLGLQPMLIEVVDDGVEVASGVIGGSGGQSIADQAVDEPLVVTLSPAAFSDWVNWIANVQRLMMSGDLTFCGGSQWSLLGWQLVLRTLTHGVPVHEPGSVTFVDRSGQTLDLHRIFGPDDDPADIRHFLSEAGYLHLRGWLDPQDMAVIAQDIERAVSLYAPGDGRSWWATLESGEEVCVRMLRFIEHSERTAAILGGPIWERVREAIGGGQLVAPQVSGNVIEGLIKPIGVVSGLSDVPWHRDCSLGSHPFKCSGVVAGISVTEGTIETGLLRAVAGSHRTATVDDPEWAWNDLPVVPLPTQVGDITVHLPCTIHEALPPRVRPRKVMYTGFGCPDVGDIAYAGALPARDVRNEAHKLVSQPDNATRTGPTA